MAWFFGSKNEDENKTGTHETIEGDAAKKGMDNEQAFAPSLEDSDKSENAEENKNGKTPEVVLQNILDGMDINDQVFREDEVDEIKLKINGEHSALLIGKRGQTLDSLEYLLNRICSPREKGNHKRITLDAEDYRKKREEKIVSLVRKLAEKVADTKIPETLRPMNPLERKIAHTALQSHEIVGTRSEGEGFYKSVIISCKNIK